MSSQGQGAAFYNMPDSSGYRLIELPPELEATLTAPGAPVLYIEPGANDTTTLRSPDAKYRLKQKNTSNGMFLLKPHTTDASSPEISVASITTFNETVELERIREIQANPKLPHTGSKGRWHEKFGLNR